MTYSDIIEVIEAIIQADPDLTTRSLNTLKKEFGLTTFNGPGCYLASMFDVNNTFNGYRQEALVASSITARVLVLVDPATIDHAGILDLAGSLVSTTMAATAGSTINDVDLGWISMPSISPGYDEDSRMAYLIIDFTAGA